MEHLNLIGFKEKEIPNVSGKSITFKKITIPNNDCSQFKIRYRIVSQRNGIEYSSPIDCAINSFQKDLSYKDLNTLVKIPNDSILWVRIEPIHDIDFNGNAFVDYEIFFPLKIIVTESDRQNAHRIALVNIARFFNIQSWETASNDELHAKINSIKDKSAITIIGLLNEYFKSYDEWFQFYQVRKKIQDETGVSTALNESERFELLKLINNRDDKREALQKEFDKLQFEDFQKKSGLQGITGIIADE